MFESFRRKPRPIPRDMIPREAFTMPPADAVPSFSRLPDYDPGDVFKPKPAPRTDRSPVMPLRPRQVGIVMEAGLSVEVRWQIANGDWTSWKDAQGAAVPPVAVIGGAWRVKGAE